VLLDLSRIHLAAGARGRPTKARRATTTRSAFKQPQIVGAWVRGFVTYVSPYQPQKVFAGSLSVESQHTTNRQLRDIRQPPKFGTALQASLQLPTHGMASVGLDLTFNGLMPTLANDPANSLQHNAWAWWKVHLSFPASYTPIQLGRCFRHSSQSHTKPFACIFPPFALCSAIIFSLHSLAIIWSPLLQTAHRLPLVALYVPGRFGSASFTNLIV
jgi:hypothetical protein